MHIIISIARLSNKHVFLFKRKEMDTKLTLTIEKEVIEIAKEYAKEKGQSLSEMVENYFKFVTVSRKKLKKNNFLLK
jgi:hypothetical protein